MTHGSVYGDGLMASSLYPKHLQKKLGTRGGGVQIYFVFDDRVLTLFFTINI